MPGPKDNCLPRRCATFLTAMILLWSTVPPSRAAAHGSASALPDSDLSTPPNPPQNNSSQNNPPPQIPSIGAISAYEGKPVLMIEISGVLTADRDHLLQLLPQLRLRLQLFPRLFQLAPELP